MNKKIVVVGSGTAGALAATYLKKYYKHIDVVHIREKDERKIGVGESTTPLLLNYFDVTGLSISKFLNETNSTIKIGIRFENWLLENDTYWHNFKEIPTNAVPSYIENAGLINLTDILDNKFANGGSTYSGKVDLLNKVPFALDHNNKLQVLGNYALHVDAEEFSEYILREVQVDTLFGSVTDVHIVEGNIKNITLDDRTVIEGDLFIDCTGFSQALVKELPFEWESFSDWLSVNSAVAGRVYTDDSKSPVTIATAQDFGWIWHIPLKDRYGVGYVFDNEFIDFEEIKIKLKDYCKNRLGGEIVDISHVKFEPGCVKNNWIGNCIAIGLSSGFVEPLEATNIHTIIYQISRLARHYDGTENLYTKKIYNEKVYKLQKNIKEVVKLHYLNRQENTAFWKKINQIDDALQCKIEGLSQTFANLEFIEYNNNSISGSDVFLSDAYTSILHGLGYFNKDTLQNFATVHSLPLEDARNIIALKEENLNKYITQDKLIKEIKNGK